MQSLLYYVCFHDECERWIMRVTFQKKDNVSQICFWKNNQYETHVVDEFLTCFELQVFDDTMRIFLSGNRIAGYGQKCFFYGMCNHGTIESFLCRGCHEDQCNQMAHTCLMNSP